jgi:hypothetical protein
VLRGAARDGLLPHGFALGTPNTWTEVWPFLAAGIPGINVSTFTDEFDRTQYHTQYDTSGRVDFGYLERLTEVAGRFLAEADAGAADALDYAARAKELEGVLPRGAVGALRKAKGRERFNAVARGLEGLDERESAAYPHARTARDVELLERALRDVRAGRRAAAARKLEQVGLNWLCADLGREAFRIERRRRGRAAPRACWAALGDPDRGPDLWDELASLRGEGRDPGTWLEERLERHLERSRAELGRRLERMAAAARGKVFPLPRPKPQDIPGARR